MPTIEDLTARKQALDAERLRLRAEAKAVDAAQADTDRKIEAVAAELKDAETWLALPKAARKRIYALTPETVAAFSDTLPTVGGARLNEWLALKLKKRKVAHVFMRTSTSYPDTPEGKGVKILGSRGREWCMKLDNEPVNPA